jgi:hypothetical protein
MPAGTVAAGQVAASARRLARYLTRAEGELIALRAGAFSRETMKLGAELGRIAKDARRLAIDRSSAQMGALGVAMAVLKAHVGRLSQKMRTVCPRAR